MPRNAHNHMTVRNPYMSFVQYLFPVTLWPYVENVQKPLVQARMRACNQEILEIELAGYRNNLRIKPNRPHCCLYYEAQALAN